MPNQSSYTQTATASEQTLQGKAEDITSYLTSAIKNLEAIESRLFGSGPKPEPKEGLSPYISLEIQLKEICSRAVCLNNLSATVLSKL